MAPSGTKAASKQAKRNEDRQEELGEHQDSLVTSQLLRRLGSIAGTTGVLSGSSYAVQGCGRAASGAEGMRCGSAVLAWAGGGEGAEAEGV